MNAPFLKYVVEGRIVRRPGDLQRYTFQEICEKIYLSFLGISLLKNFSQTANWVKSYSRETMTYGDFDKVRYSANDLHNMLAVVDGDSAITQKLSNKNAALALRQRLSLPTLAVKRYLRMLNSDYEFLASLERSLQIKSTDYKNLRLAIASFNTLDGRRKKVAVTRLLQAVRAKLSGTDIARKVEEFSKKQKFELNNVVDAEVEMDADKTELSGAELNAYRILVGPSNVRRAKMAVDMAKDGKGLPSNIVSAYLPIMKMVDDIIGGGYTFVKLVQSIHERAKKARK
tara:strand:+ start:875 stop:1732 length:858 start_codon:yes stop_codon:yes gene_type:complete